MTNYSTLNEVIVRTQEEKIKAPKEKTWLSFEEQVDRALTGEAGEISHIEVMSHTPPILRVVGVPNHPILMTTKHLRTVTQESGKERANYHGLEVETVKRLPQLLSDPVMIFDSLTRNDSIVVITNTTNKENHPIIGAVQIEGIGRLNKEIIQANILLSVYGKENFISFIRHSVEEGKLLYFDKEKSQALSVNPGIQFPDVMATLDSDTIIRKTKAFVKSSGQGSSEMPENNGEGDTDEIDRAREAAHAAGLPFSSTPFDSEEDFNPYVYDGSMSVEDYKKMWKAIDESREEKNAEEQNKGAGSTSTQEKNSRTPKREQNESGKSKYVTVTVPKAARIATYKKSSLMKMPNGGKYEGYCYYFSNALMKESEDGKTIRLSISDNFNIQIRTGKEEKREISREDFMTELNGRTEKDYRTKYMRPSEYAFKVRKENLIKNVPNEMKARPNWVAMKTIEKEGKEHLGKKLINCHTGGGAKIDDPTTWTDFNSALAYAEEMGADTVAYALTDEDSIACIDIDGCIGADGSYSKKAEETLKVVGETYCEKSISGTGLHLFGKTNRTDKLQGFSQDREMEFYRNNRFMSMTGNLIGSGIELQSFDAPNIMKYITDHFKKIPEQNEPRMQNYNPITLRDEEVLDKMFASANGKKLRALYNGENLLNNRSNSDMSFMASLAWWCNGDKDQMIRIFRNSGLFRPEKSPDYYETTANKAIKNVNGGYSGQRNNSAGEKTGYRQKTM